MCFAACLALSGSALHAAEQTNVMGRQSQNEGLVVVPVPAGKKVTIDGDLSDWELSGRMQSFADWDLRDSHSVETAAMYDTDNFYISYKWRDPSPMLSAVNPDFNPSDGWRSDAVQMRLHTDRNLWITVWYYTADKVPVMHISYWKNDSNNKLGQDITVLRAKAGGSDLGEGVEMSYKMAADGKGFVQEVKIPWSKLYRKMPEIKAGLTFKLGLEFLWGDDKEGKNPEHRYADNMQPGATSREFFWTAVRSWGDAKLVAEPKVAERVYTLPKTTLPGTIPVRFSVPENAIRMTVVIEDEKGKRIRNLVGDVTPQEYQKGLKGAERQVEVMWDGLDDSGKLVPVGKYKVRGLTRGSFDATFDAVFYNPGNPPWYTLDGTGGFGSNHASPERVARAGDKMILAFVMSEGGHALVGYNAEDKKIWGENRGAHQLTADEKHVYTITREVWTKEKKTMLYRYNAADGSYAPFVVDGKPRSFELEVTEVVGDSPVTEAPVNPTEARSLTDPLPEQTLPTGLAVGKTQLALALPDGRLCLLDKVSAKLSKTLKPGKNATALAFEPKTDDLYAIIEGKLVKIDKESGATSLPFATPNVAKPVSIIFDPDGNLAIADGGPDSDVKVFSSKGEQIAMLGKKGGRPVRGLFDPSAMTRVNSIAYDAKGRLWAAERFNFPRRFSVWKKDGSLDKDFVGGTGYAATSTFLHDTNPELAYCGPIEMKLDREKGTWAVTRILWYPEEGENFVIDTGSHAHPQRFSSKASGQLKEYMFVPADRQWEPAVILMEKGDVFQPVAAVGRVISMVPNERGKPTAQPSGLFEGKSVDDGFYWNDLNGDAKMQKEELTFIPATGTDKKKPVPGLNVYGGWGTRMSSDDLSFYTDGITAYRPTGYSKDGAPQYGKEGTTTLPLTGGGDIVPLPGTGAVAQLNAGTQRTNGVDGIRGIDLKTNSVMWTYPNPYHSVHGSHRAPMARPGLIVGPLKIMGTAQFVKGDIGTVFAIRGNLGEDYFFTSDGLYAGALFNDCRRPTEGLPPKVEDLKKRSLAGFSEGGEPFSGWFGLQSDGKVRIGTSIGRNVGLTVVMSGLDSLKRFQGPELEVTPTDLAKADADNIARASSSKEKKAYVIKRVEKPINVDGKSNDWSKLTEMQVGHPGDSSNAEVKLAYDATNLYAFYEVQDASPMLNSGKDLTELFKSGDSVDMQLATNITASKDRRDAGAGDVRLLIAEVGGKPVAVLSRPVDPTAPKTAAKTYSSPVQSVKFDRVAVLDSAKVVITRTAKGYTVEAAIPLADLGLKPEPGLEIRGDVGFISSDSGGLINTARTYWSNKNTGLVNDLPGEASLKPGDWGSMQFSD
ncbi:MAG TPA: hypothetical protein VK970_08375 [Candidatus Methylacidiphilales bacterium]|nr:hypothetical protein [Candidatus Methylacidiphilales bacterium]